MSDDAVIGRRERKKAATRQAIADAAMTLFLDRGFDAVTMREIADRADVSLATVYAHFPQKEALVFDEDDERRASLMAAVSDRPAGQSISDALHAWLAGMIEEGRQYAEQEAAFQAMVANTPSLSDYERAMWLRHEGTLADVIAAELGLDGPDVRINLFAHFILDAWTVIDFGDDPMAGLDAAFALIGPGWARVESAASV